MPSALATDLLDALDKLAGGVHPGFRPVHARGLMYSGTFTPSPEAAKLTRAPHAVRPTTPVTVRFSLAAGIPTVADNDPMEASPQAYSGPVPPGRPVHTDIIAHSVDGFPAGTGEEVLEFVRAAAASGPGAPTPSIIAFLAAHRCEVRGRVKDITGAVMYPIKAMRKNTRKSLSSPGTNGSGRHRRKERWP
jgi:catalase